MQISSTFALTDTVIFLGRTVRNTDIFTVNAGSEREKSLKNSCYFAILKKRTVTITN